MVILIALMTLAVAGVSQAAGGEDDARAESGTSAVAAAGAGQQSGRRDPDFLFGRPRTFVGASGGWLTASQSGGIFDFTRDLLTIDEGAFDAGMFRFSVGRALSPRLELVGEVGVSRATIDSEYRDFVDTDDLPIVQTTKLSQVPLGGSLRFWLTPRGREVSRFAWVPSRLAVYVGGGGGAQWYRFWQFGDFVDFVDLSIFNDGLESTGWAASGHLLAGASINVARRLFLSLETRYGWANTSLSGDFVGFDNIDLNGLQSTAGIEIVF